MDQKGFTLIELIVIIVILGILAVTAIPKYVDMKTDAEEAAADGVYAACQGATSMNFAGNLLEKAGLTLISTGAQLEAALDGSVEGWAATGNDYATTGYTITVDTPETATAKAGLTKTW
jgi:MSHA pilin protein MshA